MTDQTTVLLYALSTLAQTCAALAAFVGAVGLYKLQSVRDQHARNEQTLRGLAATVTLNSDEAARETIDRILQIVEAGITSPPPRPPAVVENARKALGEWHSFPSRRGRAATALLIFEGWHLLVIGAALIGFNYVNRLTTWAGTFWVLWAVALGTVAVTGLCVFAWTWTRE